MTRQVSPAAGTSNFTYNEHSELATETDARNIVTTRTTDVLDRVTAVTYPNATLNTTYTYDTGPFGKGRLTGITRQGETLAYAYDRFGRLLQNGMLTYGYDKNGNRETITYPESITAPGRRPWVARSWTYDKIGNRLPCAGLLLILLFGRRLLPRSSTSMGRSRLSTDSSQEPYACFNRRATFGTRHENFSHPPPASPL